MFNHPLLFIPNIIPIFLFSFLYLSGTSLSFAANKNKPQTSTPYLFVKSSGKFYVENDVMDTYHNTFQEIAKRQYEKNGGDHQTARQEEFYKIQLKPDISAQGMKMQLVEMEPEESHIDQARLIRIIHPAHAYVFTDQESNTIKAIHNSTAMPPQRCRMQGSDCLKAIKNIDDTNINADKGARMTISFDLKGHSLKDLYLTINAWKKPVDKPQLDAYKPDGQSIVPVIILNADKGDKAKQLKHLHPRAIASRLDVALGDALKGYTGEALTLELQWTNHHFVDYVALLESEPVSFKKEELSLIKATDYKSRNVLWRLQRKDKIYVHTVRGQKVDLTFARPRKTLKAGETETYFFASSGYYHGLRTYLYPKADPSEESFRQDLQQAIDERNKFLKSKTP